MVVEELLSIEEDAKEPSRDMHLSIPRRESVEVNSRVGLHKGGRKL